MTKADNGISSKGACALSEALKYNTALTTLELGRVYGTRETKRNKIQRMRQKMQTTRSMLKERAH